MNDQQRLLLASVLMAAVLVVAWFLGSLRDRQPSDAGEVPQVAVVDTSSVIPPVDSVSIGSGSTSISAEDSTGIATTDSTPGEGVRTPAERTVIVRVLDPGGAPVAIGALSSRGGALTSWVLPGFEDLTGTGGPVDLLAAPAFATCDSDGEPVMLSTEAPDTVVVAAAADSVVFSGEGGFRKVYTFGQGSYCFGLAGTVGDAGTEIDQGILATTEQQGSPAGYFQAAWYAEKYRTAKTSSLEEEMALGRVRWAGVRSQYFCILLLPAADERFDAFAWSLSRDSSPAVRVLDQSVRVYAGPVDYEELRALGGGTDKLVDFGWPIIRWIGQLIYLFLASVLSAVGNWGLRIVILSAVLKALLWPLSFSSAKSMRRMQKLQPQMQELQKKYANEPMRQRQEMQKLYKEAGVNPLGGCLPLLLQMPIFFALYRVLQSGIDLRGAGFFLWMTDLSRPEILIPFATPILGMPGIGLLAVLMGVSMFWQQKLTMTDPSQKAMLYMMPVMMTWLFMKFPAGLTLYWFVNNILSIAEQMILRRSRSREPATPVPARPPRSR